MKKKKISKNKLAISQKKITTAIILIGDEKIVKEFTAILDKSILKILDFGKSTPKSVRAYDLVCALELTNLDLDRKRKNLSALDKLIPKSVPIITSSVCVSVATQSKWVKNPQKLIGVSAFPTLIQNNLVEIAPSIFSKNEVIEKTREFFAKIGKKSIVVQDRVGLVLPRILSQIINEAFFTIQQNVSNPKDIDLAMKLAAEYPIGPIEWGEKIGFEQIEALLKSLFVETMEERYKISPLLTQFILSKSKKN